MIWVRAGRDRDTVEEGEQERRGPSTVHTYVQSCWCLLPAAHPSLNQSLCLTAGMSFFFSCCCCCFAAHCSFVQRLDSCALKMRRLPFICGMRGQLYDLPGDSCPSASFCLLLRRVNYSFFTVKLAFFSSSCSFSFLYTVYHFHFVT